MKLTLHIKVRDGQWGRGSIHAIASGAQHRATRNSDMSILTQCGRQVYGTIVDSKDNPVDCGHCLRVQESRST